MKSWVSSAFSDLASTNNSISKTKEPSKRPERFTKNAPNSSITPLKTIQINNTRQFNCTTNKPCKNEPNLAEKYAPVSRIELVVHKAKVDQLSSIIDDITGRKKGSILLIDGPTGCGKTVILNLKLKYL